MKRKIIFFTSISLFLLLASVGIFFVIKHSKNNVSEQVTDGEQKYFYIEVNGGDFEITNGKETAYKGEEDIKPYYPYIEGDLDMSFAGFSYKIPDFESEEQEYTISFLKDRSYDLTFSYYPDETKPGFFVGLDSLGAGTISISKRKEIELKYIEPTKYFMYVSMENNLWDAIKVSLKNTGISVKFDSNKAILYSEEPSILDIRFFVGAKVIEVKDIPIDKEGITISSDRRGNCIIKRKWKVLHKEYFGWPEEE
ncbi:MAG: hypothetical protein E7288_04450 [Lachnospiraceae bacterium]|nr:hypothetical protein [Lachnospiraceae bacterium]